MQCLRLVSMIMNGGQWPSSRRIVFLSPSRRLPCLSLSFLFPTLPFPPRDTSIAQTRALKEDVQAVCVVVVHLEGIHARPYLYLTKGVLQGDSRRIFNRHARTVVPGLISGMTSYRKVTVMGIKQARMGQAD